MMIFPKFPSSDTASNSFTSGKVGHEKAYNLEAASYIERKAKLSFMESGCDALPTLTFWDEYLAHLLAHFESCINFIRVLSC